MPGTVPGSRVLTVNKTDKTPFQLSLQSNGMTDNKQIHRCIISYQLVKSAVKKLKQGKGIKRE